jgi:hypothetical protein
VSDLDAAVQQAEDALAAVALRYPNGWGGYDTLHVCTSALRALLDAAKGSARTLTRDDWAKAIREGATITASDASKPGGSTPLRSEGVRTEFPGFTFPAPQPNPSLLGRIESACGIPDPAQACRVILALCREARERAPLDLRITPAPLLAASRFALAVLTDLAESAAYWSDYDVPVGLLPRVDEARARLAAALEGGPR